MASRDSSDDENFDLNSALDIINKRVTVSVIPSNVVYEWKDVGECDIIQEIPSVNVVAALSKKHKAVKQNSSKIAKLRSERVLLLKKEEELLRQQEEITRIELEKKSRIERRAMKHEALLEKEARQMERLAKEKRKKQIEEYQLWQKEQLEKEAILAQQLEIQLAGISQIEQSRNLLFAPCNNIVERQQRGIELAKLKYQRNNSIDNHATDVCYWLWYWCRVIMYMYVYIAYIKGIGIESNDSG